MKLLLASICALSFTACKEEKISGQLNLKSPLVILNSNANQVQLIKSSYGVVAKITSDESIDLKIATEHGEISAPLKLGFRLSQLKNGDQLQIDSAVSGQPFTLSGNYKKAAGQENVMSESEACTFTNGQQEHVCKWVPGEDSCESVTECSPTTGSCKTREVCEAAPKEYLCEYRPVELSGRRSVEYYFNGVATTFEFNITNANKQAAGKIVLSKSEGQKVYNRIGECW